MATSPAERGGRYDVAVLGAGPAGLSAAAAAVRQGASVVLLDAAPRPGGQYWRHRAGDDGARHHDWEAFRRLRAAIGALGGPGGAGASGTPGRSMGPGRVDVLPGHAIWHVEHAEDGFTVHALCDGADREVRSRTVVVATGAYDRQLPFPGWTLPGVFTAGAVQALLKGHGVLAGRRVVVAGTGPFLLPVGAGLVEAGAEVAGVFEAGRPTAFARHPLVALRSGARLIEGARYLRTLLRHRVPYRMRTAVVGAVGTDTVTGARVARLDAQWGVIPGSERVIACDTIAVGYGFTPQTEIPVQLGCAMELDADGSLVVQVDGKQRTTVVGAWVAGEACGIGGARLSAVEGELAGLYAARAATGAVPDPRTIERLMRLRSHHRAFAAVLHEAFPIRMGWQEWLAADTAVCRCEEVTVAALGDAVEKLGATDARAAKLLARAGMGLCQGRVCGYGMAALVAARLGRAVTGDDLRGIAGRPIAQPVPLGAIAGLQAHDDDVTEP
jgi:thioredoxin reductase